jgi:hypothetical protein
VSITAKINTYILASWIIVTVRCGHVLVCYHGREPWSWMVLFENRVLGKIRGPKSDEGPIPVSARLRCGSAAIRFLGLRVRVLPGH